MDIITIIEQYIELSVRHDRLNNAIQTEEDGYNYAKIEGDMAYYDKNYKLERMYNDSARNHREMKQNAEKELLQVQQLLAIIHATYTETVESLSASQLNEAAITLSVKKAEVERRVNELSQRREWARSKGDIAYNERNFSEEQEYNRISSECYLEIRKIEPTIHYYEAFINNLNYHASKKVDQDFSQGGPGIK